MRSSIRSKAVFVAMVLAALGTEALAQVSCELSQQVLDVFLPGGGAFIPGGGTLLVDGSSPVNIGVYCEGSGEFPPPTIAGATYAWSTGQADQRIQIVDGLPVSGTATYSVAISSPSGRKTLTANLRSALPESPHCQIVSSTPQPMTPGSILSLSAVCSPAASSYLWDAREFLGYMSIVGPADQQTVQVRFNGAQPGQIMPIYLISNNASGQGPYASFLATAGNPDAALPLNPPLVSAGGAHTCAITTAGGVKCWGDDTSGQLGDYRGTVFYSTTPVDAIGAATGIASVASGNNHSCVLRTSGTVACWGDNSQGQLGDGTRTSSLVEANVVGLSGTVAGVVLGPTADHSCALTTGGVLECWGRNDYGQLGTGSRLNAFTPSVILGNVSEAALGSTHTCAVTGGGAPKCWGGNDEGQLGDGTTNAHAIPQAVSGLSGGVVSVVAGQSHTCALMSGGNVKCWGLNQDGELGTGSPASASPVPGDVVGLANVTALSAGAYHTCALIAGGTLRCWGRNSEGQLGDGTLTSKGAPVAVPDVTNVLAVSAGAYHTCALIAGGGVLCWGLNGSARLGDGTVASHVSPQLALGELGKGFLDLTLEDPFQPPADKVPVFPLVASGTLTSVTANVQFRAQDLGTVAKFYVFALAPSTIVQGPIPKDAQVGPRASGTPRDAPVQCVLAQLNASGQLQGVSVSQLQAFASGVLTDAGKAFAILNNQSLSQLQATYFAGYGTDPNSMMQNGTNRSVVGPSAPGSVSCQPQAPQTGWWWNPAEGGRGFSIEAQGNQLFFAVFEYDESGRATWNVSPGTTSMDGSYFTSSLYAVSGGQTLGGPYRAPVASPAGTITLLFNDSSHGTMIWPGGAVPIERMNLVPGGLAAAPQPGAPENGWWWNKDENGRGFFMEWQDGYADIAGYMYDDSGNPVWYITVYPTPNPLSFAGSWWQYANGQTMTGTYRPATRINDNVAPVTIQFLSTTSAVMTLPNGRTTNLVRQRF